MPINHKDKNLRALIAFLASAAFFIFAFGYIVGKHKLFPYPLIAYANQGFLELKTQLLRFESLGGKADKELPTWMHKYNKPIPAHIDTSDAYPGLNLITRSAKDFTLRADITDMDGKVLHEWIINWFDIWPDATHVPDSLLPKNKPGTQIHGAVIMDNGDLVFNFDHQGLVRLGLRGEVVWRLPYLTHHSVHLHDDGNLWVCGRRHHTTYDARLPNRVPPFDEYTILEVTPDGKIAGEWSVADILIENGQAGLLYLGTLANDTTKTGGDVLHLNDVEPFPASMKPGFFKKGDILVSLRNINTVFVFNRTSRKIKCICTGWFVRQHDPDFLDGNRFSVLDNNLTSQKHNPQSRIVIVSAPDRTAEAYFEGNETMPFYTPLMGKHQWLPNGNLLITESCIGRAFEINQRKEVVWEYINFIDKGYTAYVTEVQRIPLSYARLFKATTVLTEKTP